MQHELGRQTLNQSSVLAASTGIRQGWTSRLFLTLHSVAHWLGGHGLKPLGRVVQVLSRFLYGSDIDAMACISRRAVIPHTVGIVIGETTIIDEAAVIMPNVVLGARQSDLDGRRHPHICRGALVGAGAVVLGPVTIGENAKIGANSVVLENVAPGTTVVGNPARQIERT
ncbi:MAG: serine acetyltransferase [Phycisphaerae bacterium]|nr:serine acetyltransferase [Phycisphaerae bacterium]